MEPFTELANGSAGVGIVWCMMKGDDLVMIPPPKIGLVECFVGSHLSEV
eukprot:CAMPEP_0116561322 /NCGR_PEP_ID=MMETSP0397-20121206/11515_1 /TAXON_ID=216820 /ORGANISM="Cyclophora tenuis, Strain ECT3854" /LENGTH=48 /DNA_ID= /DNA_START= /DNA_END= /DNA_ORIENTATION=